MLWKTLNTARDLGRLHEIAAVLVRHGLGDIVHRTGVAGALESAGRVLRVRASEPSEQLSLPERCRRALEELGPTFVKLGQVLASRSDLLPPEWVEQFSKLHEEVSELPFEALREQLEEDLGASPHDLFDELDEQPLAAGSIAQVHRAKLPNGRDVVLKVRRPGIEEEVLADLRLLARLGELLEQEVRELRRYRPRRIAREFARTMKAEMDLAIEAKNLRAIADNLSGQPSVAIPEVIDGYTRERLLVLSHMEGLSAAEWIAGNRPEGLQPAGIAQIGAEAVLHMVFVDGLYHADPHPGNVLFLPDGRIGLLDFGMVGRLSEDRRREFLSLLSATADHDEAGVVDALVQWTVESEPDLELLQHDARAFLDRYHGVPLKHLDVTRMLRDLTEIVRENNLSLPADVAMLMKVFVTLEGLGRALDPDFDMSAHVEGAADEMMERIASPSALAQRGLVELRRMATSLPSDLRAVMTRMRRGEFRIEMDMKRLEQFGNQIDRSANRLTLGLVTSALIVGTSIAMTVGTGPSLFGLPAIGLLGFASSMIVGMWLVWQILRSGRH